MPERTRPSTTSPSSGESGSRSPRTVRLDQLKLGLSPRPIDEDHVTLLAQTLEHLPPVLVHRETSTLVDGLHRVIASQRAGLDSIAVVWFDGSLEEASVEAIRTNVRHGKPLTWDERMRAARRLLDSEPARSDRLIADICGLAPETIANLREQSSEHDLDIADRDGRRRPRITHRRPVAAAGPELLGSGPADGIESADYWWERDAVLDARNPRLVAWLTATTPDLDPTDEMLAFVPPKRAHRLAEEARRRSVLWMAFAAELGGKAPFGSR